MNDTEMLIAYSENLIPLIKRATTPENKALIEKGLTVWLYNYPTLYKKFLTHETGLIPTDESALYIDSQKLEAAVSLFKKQLGYLDGLKVFLLNDARIFATKGNPNDFMLDFSRRFLTEENYLYLFSLVDKAFLKSQSWQSFRQNYSALFKNAIKHNKQICQVKDEIAPQLSFLPNRGKVTFVDTGLQGTLALFLAETALLLKPGIQTDIRLFCTYPWLAAHYIGRFYTDDTSYLFSLERFMEKGDFFK